MDVGTSPRGRVITKARAEKIEKASYFMPRNNDRTTSVKKISKKEILMKEKVFGAR